MIPQVLVTVALAVAHSRRFQADSARQTWMKSSRLQDKWAGWIYREVRDQRQGVVVEWRHRVGHHKMDMEDGHPWTGQEEGHDHTHHSKVTRSQDGDHRPVRVMVLQWAIKRRTLDLRREA